MTNDEILHFLCEEIVEDRLMTYVAYAMQWGMEAQKSIDMHRLRLSANNIYYCGERFDDITHEKGKEDLGWGAK